MERLRRGGLRASDGQVGAAPGFAAGPRSPKDTAVWTGQELMVFGGARAVAYDPVRARWTTLPPAPVKHRDRHAAVWTGTEMLIFGGCCRGSRHHRDGALYSPR